MTLDELLKKLDNIQSYLSDVNDCLTKCTIFINDAKMTNNLFKDFKADIYLKTNVVCEDYNFTNFEFLINKINKIKNDICKMFVLCSWYYTDNDRLVLLNNAEKDLKEIKTTLMNISNNIDFINKQKLNIDKVCNSLHEFTKSIVILKMTI